MAKQISSDLLHHFLFASVHMFTELEQREDESATATSTTTTSTTDTTLHTTEAETSSDTILISTTNTATPTSTSSTRNPSPATSRKLENMGFCVGRRLIERQTRDDPPKRLENNMSIMRYICKDFWPLAFDHPASRLRTNHRGIFVIEDSAFKLIEAIGPMEGVDAIDAVRKYLAIPIGLLRGALASLGINCVVDATVEIIPVVQFTVQCSPMVPSRE